jgi:quinol monooxygenase YgiN
MRGGSVPVGGFRPKRADPLPTTLPVVAEDVELAIVTMAFDAADPARLQPVLAKYVVVSRGHPGCRNIDLCLSVTKPERFVVIQKWESLDAQRAHFDSAEMVEMAAACRGLLQAPPAIDLLTGISAHDLM